jgi:hypothetical protein
MSVGDGTFAQAYQRSYRFRLDGSPNIPVDQRSLVPETQAAADLLNGPHADRAQQALKGMLLAYEGAEHHNNLQGIALGTARAPYLVNEMLEVAESGSLPKDLTPVTLENATKLRDGMAQMLPLIQAHNLGWISLGPVASRQLIHQLTVDPAHATEQDRRGGTSLAHIVAHETQHGVHPFTLNEVVPKKVQAMTSEERMQLPPDKQTTNVNWIEEATADTLAMWPGDTQRTARAMGIAYESRLPAAVKPSADDKVMLDTIRTRVMCDMQPDNFFAGIFRPDVTNEQWAKLRAMSRDSGDDARTHAEELQSVLTRDRGYLGYPVHVRAMRQLLSLAGINPQKVADYDRAHKLLQGANLIYVPGRLAQAIAAEQHLPDSAIEPLRELIRDAGPGATLDPSELKANMPKVLAFVQAQKGS